MDFAAISADVLLLITCMVLTVVLILFGKYVGKITYGWYWELDPNSYQTYKGEVCSYSGAKTTCTEKTDEQLRAESKEMAEADGRWAGAWLGFFIGASLTALKAYDIYQKMKLKN